MTPTFMPRTRAAQALAALLPLVAASALSAQVEPVPLQPTVVTFSVAAGGPYGASTYRVAGTSGVEVRLGLERNEVVDVAGVVLRQPTLEVGVWWGDLRGEWAEEEDDGVAATRWSARLKTRLDDVADGVQLYGALEIHLYDVRGFSDNFADTGGASGALGLLVHPKALWEREAGSQARIPWLRGFVEVGGEARSGTLSPTVSVGLSMRLTPTS